MREILSHAFTPPPLPDFWKKSKVKKGKKLQNISNNN
jgi:hypothetical protein